MGDPLPSTQEGLELRLQPASTFTATSCPHCDNVFQVEVDFQEIKDNVEFERLKKKELDAQKEAYKREITRFQEEVNSLKETLANLCNQLAQSQVENLRSKQASIEQDNYIKSLKDHLKQSEAELHALAADFETALERNRDLQATHKKHMGQIPGPSFNSKTAAMVAQGNTSAVTAQPASTPAAPLVRPNQPAPSGPLGSRAVPSYPAAVPSRGAAPGTPAYYRDQLVAFYTVHNPRKLRDVDNILQEFQGHEEDMMQMLSRKYGVASPSVSRY
eukprot:TRINITY_DN11447_c0_g1_i1.p1 TRINITY_DN11447_c0_g1~~TRINITY_DN11447_c0_g1_i1.p1  ORF type:complete len:274 (+),score=88.91 TRINITY_DN11447_c0_g1_i1:143-964(+)